MIEKILDNYTNKLIERILETQLLYYIDFKVVKNKDVVKIYIKKKNYNDKEYVGFEVLKKKDSLFYISIIDKYMIDINEYIHEYLGS